MFRNVAIIPCVAAAVGGGVEGLVLVGHGPAPQWWSHCAAGRVLILSSGECTSEITSKVGEGYFC